MENKLVTKLSIILVVLILLSFSIYLIFYYENDLDIEEQNNYVYKYGNITGISKSSWLDCVYLELDNQVLLIYNKDIPANLKYNIPVELTLELKHGSKANYYRLITIKYLGG
jgi:hypothetical protein